MPKKSFAFQVISVITTTENVGHVLPQFLEQDK